MTMAFLAIIIRKVGKYLENCGKVRTFAAVQWNVELERVPHFYLNLSYD
jgi:hypothetical protein